MSNTSPRTRIRQLVLLNWRGLFYQPFELDSAVTTLEGENGAGKTTVMIGAYVALLPDLRLLQFRNVSEGSSGDGDRGIYGRLGEKGPSYSVLDIRTHRNERLFAGVQLTRKAEPKLELTCFIIHDIPDNLASDELLLVREGELERIPELAQLRQQAGRVGARLEVFDTAGAYAISLFERGVTPMRMEAHRDREKFNRMLQTSMYGGLSSSIQKSLRDYLLVEDPNLRSHVARMRENLDACRVTRREIEQAQGQYDLIKGVYQAGFKLFEAAFHGTRMRALGYRDNADKARTDFRDKKLCHREAQLRETELRERQARLTAELQQRQEELQDARELLERCQSARRIVLKIEEEQAKSNIAEQERAQARLLQAQTDEAASLAEQLRDSLFAEKEDIANGLADAQSAWESVNRKVGLYRQAQRSLEDARQALAEREVSEANAADVLDDCETAWRDAVQRQTRAQQDLETAHTRAERFQRVFDALCRLSEHTVSPADAAQHARRVLRDFADMEQALETSRDLPQLVQRTRERLRRQQIISQKVQVLSERCGQGIDSSAALREFYNTRRAAGKALGEQLDAAKEQIQTQIARHNEIDTLIPRLEQDLAQWRAARQHIEALEELCGQACDSQTAVEQLKDTLSAKRQELDALMRERRTRQQALSAQIKELENRGGRLDDSLIALRDRVEGDLVAELYDDTPESEAAAIEARLGPLHEAILVENAAQAAQAIVRTPDRPANVWLIESGHLQQAPAGRALEDSVLVTMGDAWRLTRQPAHPVIGRAARDKEIARLQTDLNATAQSLEDLSIEQEHLVSALAELESLYKYWSWIGQPNPQPRLEALSKERISLQQQLAQRRTELQNLKAEQLQLADLLEALEQCLADAELLDETDLSDQLKQLRKRQEQIDGFRQELEQHRDDLDRLRDGLPDLDALPPSPERLVVLREQLQHSETTLAYWNKARRLLHDLNDNLQYFGYRDQESLLEENRSLLADLKARQRDIDTRFNDAKIQLERSKRGAAAALDAFHKADARCKDLEQRIQSLREDLAATGEDGSEQALLEAKRLTTETQDALSQAEAAERANRDALIRIEERVKTALAEADAAHEQWAKALRELRPFWRSWIELHRETRQYGLLAKVTQGAAEQYYERLGAPNAFNEASRASGELRTLLKDSGQGAQLLDKIDSLMLREQDLRSGYRNLQIWVTVLHFLENSIPRDIAQADDPEQALAQIEQHLTRLHHRLSQQEQELRSRSDTVANSIATRIRREDGQIRRLNKSLGDARFGSIDGIHLKLERVEAMQRLLEKMRDEPDLFNQDLALEDAMADLYVRLGGGQVKGDQLLDYRQYVRLIIEIRRMGREQWQPVKPGALSTGESIGVGAAVLMVILDAWEQQAMLLRGKRAGGSLRFLFLDEANRLSQNSLLTLAELCERMDLQLLAAAPSVERAQCGTTYRLTRRIDAQGNEEVIVRGRRLVEAATVE